MKLPKWLEEILAQADTIQLKEKPSKAMKAGGNDVIIGILEDESLRKMYQLRCQWITQFDEVRNGPGHIMDDDCPVCAQVKILDRKIRQLNKLFWNCLRGEFDLEDNSSIGIGIRANWEVVQFNRDVDNKGPSIIEIRFDMPFPESRIPFFSLQNLLGRGRREPRQPEGTA